jgi:limonene-1,2-epoxide hydrolase
MREEVIRVVEAYIDAVRKNDVDAAPLHADVVFESPLRSIRGIAAFRKGLEEFLPILKSIEVVRLTADDETCAAVLKVDTIFGLIPFLEFFQVADGQIVSIRAYFDPRPVLEGMSRMLAS